MRRFREAIQQIKALFRSEELTAEIDAEIEQHLEFMTADFIAQGLSPAEAKKEARRKFGNVTLVKEDSRDSWGTRAILDSLRNFRFGLRLCARYPSSSILAVTVLSLGVAIASMMFSLSIKLLNDSSGAALDERDVHIAWATGPEQREAIDSREFAHLQKEVRSMEYLVGIRSLDFWLHLPGQAETGRQYRGALATPNLFQIANRNPIRGRVFTAQDALPSSERVVIISDAVWSDIFFRDETALGSIAVVDGQDHRIIGIMPAGFAFPGERQLWIPTAWGNADPGNDAPSLSVAGRLKPGVSREQAQAELRTIAANLAAAFPKANPDRRHLVVTPYRDQFIDDDAFTHLIMGLIGAIVVLSLSCANAFNIIMARTAIRSHELAVRCSLGAKRSHVITQVIVDGVTLSMLGTVAGLAIAAWGLHFITESLRIFGMPGLHTFRLEPAVIIFAVAAGLSAGIVSSVIPAWRASQIDSFAILKDGSKSASSIFVGMLAKIMVVAQVAFSAVLLYLSLLLLGPATFIDSLITPYDQGSVLVAEVQLGTDPRIDSREKIAQFYDRLHQRLTAVPGVRAMALSSAKYGLFGRPRPIEIEGLTANDAISVHQPMVSSVTPEYLAIYGMEPLSGRMLNAFDTHDSPAVCVVDARFAATFFHRQNPVGQRLRVNRREGETDWIAIVGVVPSTKPDLPAGIDEKLGQAVSEILRPYAQAPSSRPTILLSAPNASAFQYRQAIRDSLRELYPQVRIRGEILTVEQRLDIVARFGKTIASAGRLFGGSIFLISIIGLYSVVSFTTARRRQEFGIRLALGASSWNIIKSVLRPWAPMIGAGLLLGAPGILGLLAVIGALQTTTTASGLLEIVTLFIAVTGAIGIASLIAVVVPAWQATKIDPIAVIRAE